MLPPLLTAVCAALLYILATAAAAAADGDPVLVFTREEVARCGRLRTPQATRNARTGAVHVVARCCGKNLCSAAAADRDEGGGSVRRRRRRRRRLDDDRDAMVVLKTSLDGGKTWGGFRTLSPAGARGYSNGAVLYDRLRDRIVSQYNHIPRGSTAPAFNATLYQRISTDDGTTWTAPRDITHFIAQCQPSVSNTQLVTAGSKTQTTSGRLVFAGHAHPDATHPRSLVCVWYSDDGGETYRSVYTNATNEVSVVVANTSSRTLYMNGRGTKPGTFPHRAEYLSHDDGATWSAAARASQLEEDDGGECERSLVNAGGTRLFSMEPRGKKRTQMVLSCSADGGSTWPESRAVNGDRRGGYSDLVVLGDKNLLAVWEDGAKPSDAPSDRAAGNFWAQRVAMAGLCEVGGVG